MMNGKRAVWMQMEKQEDEDRAKRLQLGGWMSARSDCGADDGDKRVPGRQWSSQTRRRRRDGDGTTRRSTDERDDDGQLMVDDLTRRAGGKGKRRGRSRRHGTRDGQRHLPEQEGAAHERLRCGKRWTTSWMDDTQPNRT
jgi:hypothetical protein